MKTWTVWIDLQNQNSILQNTVLMENYILGIEEIYMIAMDDWLNLKVGIHFTI